MKAEERNKHSSCAIWPTSISSPSSHVPTSPPTEERPEPRAPVFLPVGPATKTFLLAKAGVVRTGFCVCQAASLHLITM